MTRFALPLLLLLALASCTHAPPQLSPEASQDFQKTRVVKALDLLRDFAVDGEAAQPQVVPTALARKVVVYHAATLKVLGDAGTGWPHFVATTLDAFLGTLSAAEQARLAPYVGLLRSLLTELGGA